MYYAFNVVINIGCIVLVKGVIYIRTCDCLYLCIY